MKIIKWLLIFISAVVALLLIVSVFLPKERNFTQSIEIQKSPRIIFKQINSLQNWEPWSPFQEADPEMVSTYMGPAFGVGNRQEWKSKQNGDGSMEIVKSVNDNEVVYILNLGMGTVDTTWFSLERNPKGVIVTWGTKLSHLGYPMGRLMMTIFKGSMNDVFKKGLENLKAYVEEIPSDCISGDVEQALVPARKVIFMEGKTTSEGIEPFLKNRFGALMGVVKAYGLKAVGVPVAIYEGDETTVEWGVTAVLPVDKYPPALPQGVGQQELPETKAVTILHTGPYLTTSDSYYKILDYIMENGMEITGNSWEEYISDPEETTDHSELKTRIYFPVK